jgi:hypothetical protein
VPIAPTKAAGVVLRGAAVPLDDPVGLQFVTDCARYAEGSRSAAEIIARYELAEEAWAKLADHAPLQRAVREACSQRVYSGVRVREDARMKNVNSPAVLNEIMLDTRAPARERIGAAKALHAAAGEDPTSNQKPFVFTINLGAHTTKLEINKPHPQANPERELEYYRGGVPPAEPKPEPEAPPDPEDDNS